MGVHLYGLHIYNRTQARMIGKLRGVLKVLDVSGREMRQSDTVTLLNDLCLFAPSALIDPRIRWEAINDNACKAVFTTEHCTVAAELRFDTDGRLVDFISDDRYYLDSKNTPQQLRWSTPVHTYQPMHGFTLIARGDAVWHFPDREFCYIRFDNVEDITYNS